MLISKINNVWLKQEIELLAIYDLLTITFSSVDMTCYLAHCAQARVYDTTQSLLVLQVDKLFY